MTQLRAEGIVAGYGSVQILHGVSVSAGDGQVSCIFGPNGCGKSTLLKAIAGAIDTWKGRVSLDGDDITGLPSHAVLSRGLALMPQGGGVFAQLSVRDNLRMGGYTLRSRRALDERIEELLEEFPRLRENGRTFVVIEHDMELVRTICERVIVMDAGEIVAQGRFEEIARDEQVVEAYLGRPVA